MLSLQSALNTKKASLTKSSSVGIGRPMASKLPSPSSAPSTGGGLCASGTSRASPCGTCIGMFGFVSWADEPSWRISAGRVGISSFGFGAAKESLIVSLGCYSRGNAHRVSLGTDEPLPFDACPPSVSASAASLAASSNASFSSRLASFSPTVPLLSPILGLGLTTRWNT